MQTCKALFELIEKVLSQIAQTFFVGVSWSDIGHPNSEKCLAYKRWVLVLTANRTLPGIK